MLPELRVVASGIIFDSLTAEESEAISYFTSLAPLSNGTLMAGWQCGPLKHSPENTIRLARSRNEGHDWESLACRFETSWQGIPGSHLAAEMVEVEPGRLLLFTTWADRSQPDRPLFNPATEGILPTKMLYCESSDEGESWSRWLELSTGDLTGCALTGPVIRWSDGTIACAFESFKEFDDPTPVEPAAWLCLSRDGGRSFSDPWLVAQHPEHAIYYWDQRLCPSRVPGEFFGMFWTHMRSEKRDANVHWIRASIDGPRAAMVPRETSIPGQIAAIGVADDGRLLAYVVDRTAPATMTLWQSPDSGETWPEADRLVVYRHDERAAVTQGRDQIDFAAYWEDMGKWSFGHPAIRPLSDGWLLAWYAGTPDRMSIHWARVT